jgi:hypothetical protein
MCSTILRRLALLLLLAMVGAGAAALPAYAVPSYARQTGVTCAACHTSYPELTPFGRLFKLNGYVQSSEPQIGEGSGNLSINNNLPISAMLTTSFSQMSRADFDRAANSDGTHNGNLDHVRNSSELVLLPEQFSLFYAGRITPNIGSFVQVTYDGQADKFSMDNTDIRYANYITLGGSNLVYGVTLNNNPTVQDLWNSTPAWGFPFAASRLTPGPIASIQIDGNLAQQVAGLGAYAGLQKDAWVYYAELTLYKSAFLGQQSSNGQIGAGQSSPGQNVIQDAAPYVRLAAEKSFDASAWEVGALWMDASYIPYGDVNAAIDAAGNNQVITSLPFNHFTDYGIDTQYQYLETDNLFTLKGIWLHEDNHWGSLSAPNHSSSTSTLETYRVTGSYTAAHKYGLSLQSFSTTGSKDVFYSGSTTLADGTILQTSRTNSPNTTGEILELVYTPYLNTRFSLSYTMFDQFNGSASNYDNQGRNATDNNTWYLLAWLMF